MTCLLSPVWNGIQHSDANGNPLAGGKIYAYVAGSLSTMQATFTDSTGAIQNSNPMTLDSSGRGPNIWLTQGQAYTLVLKDVNDVTICVIDRVVGVYAGDSVTDSPLWNVLDATASYVSGSKLIVPGLYRAELAVGNRIRVQKSSGYVYGTITASTYLDPNTTLSVALDTGAFDNTMGELAWSSMTATEKPADAGDVSYTSSGITYTGNSVGAMLRKLQAQIDNMAAQIAAGLVTAGGTNPNAGASFTTIGGGTSSITSALGTAPVSSSVLALNPATINLTYSAGQVVGNTVIALKNFITNEAATLTLLDGVMAPGLNVSTSNFMLADGSLPVYVSGTVGATVGSYNAVYQLSINSGDNISTASITVNVTVNAAVDTGGGTGGGGTPAPTGAQTFTSNGVFTVPAGVTTLTVKAYGAGGGGSNATSHTTSTGGGKSGVITTTTYAPGYDGGSGGVAVSVLAVTAGQVFTVTIGGPGGPGTTGGAGGNSGFSNSTYNVIASGGAGGGAPGVGANGTALSAPNGYAGTPGNDIVSGIHVGYRGAGGGASASGITSAATGGVQGAVVVSW